MVDRKDKRFFDFMCSCGEKNMERCEKVYNDVLESFNEGKREVTDKDFLNEVVYSLQCLRNGQANIEHIYSDMWSGIAIKYQYDYQEELECEKEDKECKCDADPNYDCEWKTQDFWIECDRIEHGLARAYQLVKEFDESLKK